MGMPQCSPTRAAILTGRWSWNTGMQHFNTLMPGATGGLQDVETLAETMKKSGYSTHAIGKWHLGYSKKSQTPTGRGFDTYLGYLQGQTDYYKRTLASCGSQICLFRNNCEGKMSGFTCSQPMHSPYGDQADAEDFWDGDQPAMQDYGRYTLHSYMERFDRILQEHNSSKTTSVQTGLEPKPLFFYFAHQLLHIPLQFPDAPHHLENCNGVTGGSGDINRTVMCTMASQLDEAIGDIVDKLKLYGIYDNTLIWAYSDNGGM